MALLYQHIRSDTKEVFYIGVGTTESRAFSKSIRNPYWKNIVDKVGYIVEILHRDISREQALLLEKTLIAKYGRVNNKTGILSNMTDGGDGGSGVVQLESSNKKRSEKQKGIPKGPMPESQRLNLSKACLGRPSANKGNRYELGPQTPDHIEKRVNQRRGKPGNRKGIPRVKYTCDYCSKIIGGMGNLKQHENSCKLKTKKK